MKPKESIRRILKEESNIPMVIARRVSLEELDKIFERSLDENTLDYENPLSNMNGASYKTFAKFVIDIMISELEGNFDIPLIDDIDLYIEKYREPLFKHYAPIIKDRYIDIVSNNVDESVLKEEASPTIRRIFRRVDPEKMDKIFGDGLDTMMIRYHQNKHNWIKMNLDKFKSAIVSYVIVDLCIKYSEICFGAEDYYNQVWEFLLNNYSDVMEEKWKEIMLGEINESVLNEDSDKMEKFKNKVRKYIDKYGFRETARMIGMDLTSLVRILDSHIYSGLANEILLENITNGKLPTKYNEFTIFGSRMENVVYWAVITKTGHFSDDLTERIDFVATPLWDGESYTPIELDYYALVDKDGYGLFSTHSEGSMYYRTLKGQSEFESVEELFTWYEEFYLPGVYSMIMDTILPRVHDYADYELGNKR